jgi:hypothetical protein
MKINFRLCAAILVMTLASGPISADSDQNIQIMTDAARHLSWAAWMGENRANLLIKQETIAAPVAVVFGYADNAAACEALARALSQSPGVGTFKCQPIF